MANEYALIASILTGVVAFATMWQLSRKARASPTGAGPAPAPYPTHDHLMLKFVVDAQGQRKGETVAVEGDRVVVKVPEGFAVVAASSFKADGGNLRAADDVDWVAARAAGEEWRTRSYKEISYSQDEVPKDAS